MLKSLLAKLKSSKLDSYSQAQYGQLLSNAITPAEEVEIRAIFTRAQR